MPDPFEALRLPSTPLAPRPAFAAQLRRRLEIALDPNPDPTPEVTMPTATTTSFTIVPYLIVDGGNAAIDFYRRAFGAIEIMRIDGPDGRIGHAELEIGGARIYLADEYPEMDIVGPQAGVRPPVMLQLRVPDVDAVFAQAVAAGADVARPVENQFYGERSGQLTDPYGHQWDITTTVEVLSPEEMQARAAQQDPGADPT
jgi:PhnB protein